MYCLFHKILHVATFSKQYTGNKLVCVLRIGHEHRIPVIQYYSNWPINWSPFSPLQCTFIQDSLHESVKEKSFNFFKWQKTMYYKSTMYEHIINQPICFISSAGLTSVENITIRSTQFTWPESMFGRLSMGYLPLNPPRPLNPPPPPPRPRNPPPPPPRPPEKKKSHNYYNELGVLYLACTNS